MLLFFCLSISYILSRLSRSLGLPNIIGPLIMGFIISIPVVREIALDPVSESAISTLAEIGMIFLLFFIGSKVELANFKKMSRRSMYIALFSAGVPFAFGFFIVTLMGYDMTTALIIAMCLSVSAEAVSISVLDEFNLVKTRFGQLIVNAGIIDDVVELVFLGLIGVIVSSSSSRGQELFHFLGDVLIFVMLIYSVRFVFIPLIWKLIQIKHTKADLFIASFIIVFFIAASSHYFKLGSVIGALFAGMVVKNNLLKSGNVLREENEVEKIIEMITVGFLAPIFFISIGLNTDFTILFSEPALVTTLIIIALVGKLFGSIVGNYVGGGHHFMHGTIIGWGMNARGAVELIVIEIARSYMSIPTSVYSAIVFMAFATTIISPIVFKQLMKKNLNFIRRKI